MKARIVYLLLVLLLLLLSGCVAPAQKNAEDESYWPTGGWRTSTPERHGIDSAKLAQFVQAANDAKGFKSFVIVRNGYIVVESYFGDKNNKKPQSVYSITKSVVSALVGIAIEEGKIANIDASVVDCFPDKTFDNLDERKKAVTLRHLLTMSSGLEWPGGTPDDPTDAIMAQKDPIRFVMNRPMQSEPGAEFNYNNGTAQVLSQYVEQAVGKSIDQYAKEKLLAPLGIADYSWDNFGTGVMPGFFGLRMTVRDVAKFGYLFLKGGEWEGKQLVPKAWVEESTGYRIETKGRSSPFVDGYGYLWWRETTGCYSARGAFGQYLMVFPDRDLIIAMEANFSGGDATMSYDQIPAKLAQELILPAVVSDSPLSENPQGDKALKALCSQ